MLNRLIHLVFLFSALLPMISSLPLPCQAEEAPPEAMMSKGRKVALTNLGIAAGIIGYGSLKWDYFGSSPKVHGEGWFGRNTPEGGMDKLGHLFTSYALTDGLSALYASWGYAPERASRLGAFSAVGTTALMEAGDAFSSRYGFSWEDMTMNIGGAAFGYLLGTHPELRRKIDYRVEYRPEFGSEFESDIFTDYTHLKYLLAVKADGFEAIQNRYLQYLELQLGYYARHPDHNQEVWDGTLYVGIGLNVGKLLHRWTPIPIFDYLQLPYTYLPLEKDL